MDESGGWLVVAALVLLMGGVLAVRLRRAQAAAVAELNARLALLQQQVQALLQSGARTEASSQRQEAALRDFTAATAQALEASRQLLDAKLQQAQEDARLARGELSQAVAAQQQRLEQRLDGQDAALLRRLEGMQQSLQQGLHQRLEDAARAQAAQAAQAQGDAALARKELAEALAQQRGELTAALNALVAESQSARQDLARSAQALEQRIEDRFGVLAQLTQQTLLSLKTDVGTQLTAMSTALKDQLEASGSQIRHQLAGLQEAVAQQLRALSEGSQHAAEQLRATLNERLAAIQADNSTKLEDMRRTVDEKLHATLEQRLGDSFRLVSERLEQVHSGLGEMKQLASSVGDLKRVMTNVRTRGTWGEVQLGALMDSLLTAEQYARNVKPVPGSAEVVEFAVRLPGKDPHEAVWLPIDSKFPVESHQRLLDAQHSADKDAIAREAAAFEAAVRAEARKIRDKYIHPPQTTDFAILFLPTEGLFAEVCRIPGMVEALQNDFRTVVAGPTTLAAMLNSLRLGFRTLAIERRSSEVWHILAGVKTEFRRFGQAIDATQKSIDSAAKKFGDIGVRTRAIERKLRSVEELPAHEAASLIGVDAAAAADDEDSAEPSAA